jgi:hypothetical protein
VQYKAKVIRIPNPDYPGVSMEEEEKKIEKTIEYFANIKGWTFKDMVGGDSYVLLIFEKR